MRMKFNVNESTLSLPFKWVDRIDIFWEIHPIKLEMQYEEKVGVGSWESTFVIFNEVPIEGKTFLYTRTIGDYDVNDGTFQVIDWNQATPRNYTLMIGYEDDKVINTTYLYKVQLRHVEESIFYYHFKGNKDTIDELIDSPAGRKHNGFVCISN